LLRDASNCLGQQSLLFGLLQLLLLQVGHGGISASWKLI
jgi:hypothetical protein